MKWNDEVDMIIRHVDKATGWCEATIKTAETGKDWHTERNLTRALHYLELAKAEMYDTQYETDANGKRIWQKRIYAD